MNRGLLVFSILLILLGFGLDAYLIAFFGFFLLFPALLTSPRPRPQRPPTSSGQQAPEPAPAMETTPEPAPSWGTVSAPVAPPTVAAASIPPSPISQPSFSAPLFPTSIFPIASQQMPTTQALKETKSGSPGSRDEVLELGAILTLMKLIFG
jgi:hypothetical protein